MGAVTDETDLGRMQRDLELTTPRLVLTSWLPDDVDPLFEVHSDPETMRFVRNGRPLTRDETKQLVDSHIAEHAARGWTKWRLADAEGGLLGRAGFGGDVNRQLAFAIRRSHWGSGIATEVAEPWWVGISPTRAPCTFGRLPLLGMTQASGFSRRWVSSKSVPRTSAARPVTPSSTGREDRRTQYRCGSLHRSVPGTDRSRSGRPRRSQPPDQAGPRTQDRMCLCDGVSFA